jgi:aminoglycoside 6'-N-acetyltransferase
MITFRRLKREDFPMLARWLAEPHVHLWWNHEFTPEAVERDFGATVDGNQPAEDYIVVHDGVPVGVIQYCRFSEYPDYVEDMEDIYPVGDGAVSIDYFIGDPEAVGKGLGTAMITAFSARVWQRDSSATHIVVPVSTQNEASWRALLKAGYRLVARGEMDPDNPEHDRSHEVLRLDRPSRTGASTGTVTA